MPSSKVMHEYKHGSLHSGSKHGPVVKSHKQALAIMLSEKRAEEKSKNKHEMKHGKGNHAKGC